MWLIFLTFETLTVPEIVIVPYARNIEELFVPNPL
jgi:hypothetical protein